MIKKLINMLKNEKSFPVDYEGNLPTSHLQGIANVQRDLWREPDSYREQLVKHQTVIATI